MPLDKRAICMLRSSAVRLRDTCQCSVFKLISINKYNSGNYKCYSLLHSAIPMQREGTEISVRYISRSALTQYHSSTTRSPKPAVGSSRLTNFTPYTAHYTNSSWKVKVCSQSEHKCKHQQVPVITPHVRTGPHVFRFHWTERETNPSIGKYPSMRHLQNIHWYIGSSTWDSETRLPALYTIPN